MSRRKVEEDGTGPMPGRAQGLQLRLPWVRRSEFWSRVATLGDKLERRGGMCPNAIAEFLPQPEADRPPSGAARWRDQYTWEQARRYDESSRVSALSNTPSHSNSV
ncbi:conserved hypothetical protein [Paraburkholderia piptadeniae]|uniref:Uncharacterized protein n=1 Tax=Paraburkholderia piptadeniae TaxID=1701573 RepID=A0A1N7SW74_9BURK|nr:conserved hypothetical protein [Paraburkholderia piptadeniae]